MECRRQAYWHSEYTEYQKCIKKSPSNMSYKRFAKRQFHKARRRNDKKLIQEHLKLYRTRFQPTSSVAYQNAPTHATFCWFEHNHKHLLAELI